MAPTLLSLLEMVAGIGPARIDVQWGIYW